MKPSLYQTTPKLIAGFLSLASISLSTLSCLPSDASTKVQIFNTQLTTDGVKAAQKGWCDALLTISDSYQRGGYRAAKAKAAAIIDAAYAYQYGPVAFKPTYAVGETTFRNTREGALAYFVGPDTDVKQFGPNQGFATYRNWKTCSISNDTIQLLGNTANSMGTVTLTDSNGVKGSVEKTWTFWQPKPGVIRIIMHHSSAPFDAR